MDLKTTYDRIAKDWYRDHQNDTWWIEGTEQFLGGLPQGAAVLDLGCGAGVKSRYLADRGFTVTGIDLSDGMIEIARREHPDIRFDVHDLYDLHSHPHTFDAVFAQAVLLHVPKDRIRDVLAALYRKLNPAGMLYVAVKGMRDDGVEEEIVSEDDYGYPYERFFSYYSLPELTDHFQALGLTVTWTSDTLTGKTHWLQIVGRKG